MSLHNIKISKVSNSNLDKIDFNNLKFGHQFTDHMFQADYVGGLWTNIEIKPLQKLEIHPANLAWHYGQAIFEGMKAFITKDNHAALYRPEMHINRFNESAKRMCMPSVPVELFREALETLVAIEKDWIPRTENSALYLRPLMIATDESIGVRPSDNYKFLIMTLPVGPYYPKPVTLKVEQKYIRAANGGIGEAKAAGNYAATLFPAMKANEEGFDQIMWLDSKEFKYIQEVGTMNIFFVVGNKVLTPSTDGTILKGVTRDSIIKILRSLDIEVEERPIDINEIVKAYDEGILKEVFGTGTAAVVARVSKIGFQDEILTLPEDFLLGNKVKKIIKDIRSGEIEDKWGWMTKINENVNSVI